MSKEIWLHAYAVATEDMAHELNMEFEEAEKTLDEKLDVDPNYLDGYLEY